MLEEKNSVESTTKQTAKNTTVYNLIGGIVLLGYTIYGIYGLKKITAIVDLNILAYLFSNLATGIAGFLLIADFIRNNAENQQSKLPETATIIGFAGIIPGFVKMFILYLFIFEFKNMLLIGLLRSLPAAIVVIGLCVINKESIAEFIKNQRQKISENTPAITKFLQYVGWGLLSVIIFSNMFVIDGFYAQQFYREWKEVIPWIILGLMAVCFITIKTIGGKKGNIVKLCTLYLLVIFEFILISGRDGDFFTTDGIGWMILKVACAAAVLFCQFLLISSSFKYFNKNFGIPVAASLIGAVTVATAIFAIITIIYAILIAVLAIVGYVVLMIATGGFSRKKSEKKGFFATSGDGSIEEFEESGINLMGEKTYKKKNDGIFRDGYTKSEIERGDAFNK